MMKYVLKYIFPVSAWAKSGGRFLLSLLFYFALAIVSTIVVLNLSQYDWFPRILFEGIVSLVSVYLLGGIVFAALVYLRILKN